MPDPLSTGVVGELLAVHFAVNGALGATTIVLGDGIKPFSVVSDGRKGVDPLGKSQTASEPCGERARFDSSRRLHRPSTTSEHC